MSMFLGCGGILLQVAAWEAAAGAADDGPAAGPCGLFSYKHIQASAMELPKVWGGLRRPELQMLRLHMLQLF